MILLWGTTKEKADFRPEGGRNSFIILQKNPVREEKMTPACRTFLSMAKPEDNASRDAVTVDVGLEDVVPEGAIDLVVLINFPLFCSGKENLALSYNSM